MFKALRSWLPADETTKFKGKWDAVCRYFTMVHSNNNSANILNFKEQLLDVEASLNEMMKSLASERRTYEMNPTESLPKCYEMLIKLDAHSPNGIVFHVCQHAKHNEPLGVRRVMLRFVSKLLNQADLEDQPLLGYHENVFRPILDMVQRVAMSLSPKTVSSQVGLGDMAEQHEDRVAFAHLMCALCHRLDVNNTFIELFMPDPTAAGSGKQSQQQQAQQEFVPLALLVPYITYTPITDEGNGELMSTVLKGLLHILRLRDPRIHQSLATTSNVIGLVFDELCEKSLKYITSSPADRTLFASKIDPILKFFDAVYFVSECGPAKAKLLESFPSQFLQQCLGVFFGGESDRAYVTVCSVILHALVTLKAPPLQYHLASFLLETHVQVMLRRMNDVNAEVATVTLLLLRALTESNPTYIYSSIVVPFIEGTIGKDTPVAVVSPTDIDGLFSKALRRETDGALDDYKIDVQYRYVKMSSATSLPIETVATPPALSPSIAVALIRKLDSVLDSPAEVNLALTGVITNLCLVGKARFVYGLLKAGSPTTMNLPASLPHSLTSLRHKVDQSVETNPKFFTGTGTMRKVLFGDLTMQPIPSTLSGAEGNFFGGCCVLEEFRLELTAVVSLLPLWLRTSQ
eukprot:PhF_6_TR1041/c0_g1_i2/m.2141